MHAMQEKTNRRRIQPLELFEVGEGLELERYRRVRISRVVHYARLEVERRRILAVHTVAGLTKQDTHTKRGRV